MDEAVLITLVGPTAVGKTDLAIDLAMRLHAPILSMDSRQIYREMKIGTAKPSEGQLSQVSHYFINSHSIHDYFSAGAFEREALARLEVLFSKHPHVIAVGGSGLYYKALTEGLDDMPSIDNQVRDQLIHEFHQHGLTPLLYELRKNDPDYYHQIDSNNHQRVIRALEVIRATGKPFSDFRGKQPKAVARPFKIKKVGIEMERERLNARIDRRMDGMIASGLFDEAKSLHTFKYLNALQTVGYQEIFDFLDGAYSRDEAERLLRRNTRRFAKRQMTWFKRDEDIKWFEAPVSVEEILVSLQLHES